MVTSLMGVSVVGWPLERRLMHFVEKTPTCWNWTGAIVRGYGRTSVKGKATPAHRAVYELLAGPIPVGYEPDHVCKNRRCVRPDHLDIVLRAENNRRSTSPSANNARKVRCDRGHPFTAENTYVPPSGRRVCRTCKNEWTRQRRRAAKLLCRNGHALTEGNVKVKANGTRMCLTCMARRQRGGTNDSRFRA